MGVAVRLKQELRRRSCGCCGPNPSTPALETGVLPRLYIRSPHRFFAAFCFRTFGFAVTEQTSASPPGAERFRLPFWPPRVPAGWGGICSKAFTVVLKSGGIRSGLAFAHREMVRSLP